MWKFFRISALLHVSFAYIYIYYIASECFVNGAQVNVWNVLLLALDCHNKSNASMNFMEHTIRIAKRFMRKSEWNKFVQSVFRSLFKFRILQWTFRLIYILWSTSKRTAKSTFKSSVLLNATRFPSNVHIKTASDCASNYIIISEMVIVYFKEKVNAYGNMKCGTRRELWMKVHRGPFVICRPCSQFCVCVSLEFMFAPCAIGAWWEVIKCTMNEAWDSFSY